MNQKLFLTLLIAVLIMWGQAPPTDTGTPTRDVFQNVSQTYKLSAVPVPNTMPMVFVNGLLMLQGEDYTIAATTVTFTGQQIGKGVIVQVYYYQAKQHPAKP